MGRGKRVVTFNEKGEIKSDIKFKTSKEKPLYAFGLNKVRDGWIAIRISNKGEVKEFGHPDLRMFALERMQLEFANWLANE